jgi:hypothetical protein
MQKSYQANAQRHDKQKQKQNPKKGRSANKQFGKMADSVLG